MGRKTRKPAAHMFAAIQEQSRYWGETNDCTVKALALTTGAPYNAAHATLARLGRKPRKGAHLWPVGRHPHVSITHQAFTAHSHTVEDVSVEVLKRRAGVKVLTVARAVELLPRRGRYLLWIRAHVIAVVNGQIQDWTAGRKHHVTAAARVIKQEIPA